MNDLTVSTKLDFDIKLSLTEDELRALHALTVYGTGKFLVCVYDNLGKHYLEPYENGLASIFEKLSVEAPTKLKHIEEINKLVVKNE